jgi:hypothetical protein
MGHRWESAMKEETDVGGKPGDDRAGTKREDPARTADRRLAWACVEVERRTDAPRRRGPVPVVWVDFPKIKPQSDLMTSVPALGAARLNDASAHDSRFAIT